MNKVSTYIKLDDIHNIDTFKEKLKLELNDKMKAHIKYNYFHDFWDNLVIDTGFISIKSAYACDSHRLVIRFDEEHKINKILTQVITYVKDNLDNLNGKYLPVNQSFMMCQNNPRFYVKPRIGQSNCVFLGSKTKNFKNIKIVCVDELKKMCYSNITECRFIIKPTIVNMPNPKKNMCMSMIIVKSEFKYNNSCVKSEFDKRTNNVEIISDNVNLSYNITV
jgi:hypothetical protein